MSRLSGHNCSVRSLTVNDKHDQLFSLGLDGTVKVWEVKNQKNVQTLMALGNSHEATALVYDPRHQRLVTASNRYPTSTVSSSLFASFLKIYLLPLVYVCN